MVVSVYKAHNGKYNLRRVESYGFYDSKEDAEKVAVELEKNGWDKSKLREIRKNLDATNGYKYYSPVPVKGGVHYTVQKNVNGGKQIGFGTYHDEETAKRIVEELEKVDWNKALLPRIKEKVLNENGG